MTYNENRIKMIEQFLGIKYEGTTEQHEEEFINLYKEDIDRITDQVMKQMHDVVTSELFLFESKEALIEDYVIAKNKKEAMETYVTLMESIGLRIIPEDIVLKTVDKHNSKLAVHEELVPEHDRKLWDKLPMENGELFYDVDAVYAMDYFLTATDQTVPAVMY